jgi:hypothetical protein
MRIFIKLTALLFFLSIRLQAQETEIDRLIKGELKMMFPSIHFQHKSINYSSMPYSADSCFQFIASHFKENINSLVIWKDSAETEVLTNKRIKKIKVDLKKYLRNEQFEIYAIRNEQKISRQTINKTSDSAQIKYLLSLNSVFDISKTGFPPEIKGKWYSHQMLPRPWCLGCWRNGFFISYRRSMRKAKKAQRNSK